MSLNLGLCRLVETPAPRPRDFDLVNIKLSQIVRRVDPPFPESLAEAHEGSCKRPPIWDRGIPRKAGES
jgi:hypothetical protein